MEVFDPMNIEGYPEGELSAPGGDYPGLGPSMTSKSIFKRDRWYVYNSDIILANFSMITPIVSIGSVMEIAWADAWGKAIVTIMNDQHQHGFIAEASTTLCRDLEDAIQAIGVLNRR
jgi:nucleoside 2-deoxyribosyltransferase